MVSGGLRSGSCEAERASEGELAVLTTTNQCDCRKTGQGYNVSAIVRFSAKDSILQTISQADAKDLYLFVPLFGMRTWESMLR